MTGSVQPRKYWNDLKNKLKDEGSGLSEKIGQLRMSVKEYKQLKGLKKENLRDNMTNIELVLNMLAEVTTTTISKQENPKTFEKK